MTLARILLLVAALAVAGLTAYLVKGFLDQKESELAEARKPVEVEKISAIEVLVADRDLPAGTILTPDHFRWQAWPDDGVNEQYILNESDEAADELTGAAVRRGISAGEPVTRNRVVKPGEAGFLAGVLSPGMRASTIEVDAESGAAGFILPGDRVDIVMTQEAQQENAAGGIDRKVVSETILRDIRVLAIDQTFNDIEDQTRVGKTVTVELTSKEAEGLAVAKRMGTISLALRSLTRKPEIEEPTPFTSDEEVSRFLRVRSSAVPRVLVAKHALPAGTLMRDTDFAWLQLETGSDVEGMIVEAYVSEASLRGAYLKEPVAASQPILSDNVIRPGEQGFIVAALTPGMRAVSVSVTQVSGVSGFVSPGDRVDMMLTHEVNDNSETPLLNPRRFTETILNDLKLLAIEQTVDPATGKPIIGQTVTVEVTPTQSEMVALAATMGQLSLALRSVPSVDLRQPKDRDMVSDLAVSPALRDFLIRGTLKDPNLLKRRAELSDLGSQGDAVAASVDPPKTIRVYRANQGSTVQVRR